jgi:dihydrofolate reductase
MRIEAVIAINKQRVLGDKGTVPWRAPRDMRHFRELTTGNIIVMGRRTFEAIGRVLPERENVVVTRSPDAYAAIPGLKAFSSFEAVLAHYGPDEPRALHVIGGAQLFELALPWIQRVHLTVIDDDHEGDVVLGGFEHRFVERDVWIHDVPGEPRQVFKTLERVL